jgi:signal transduction histidine kinase
MDSLTTVPGPAGPLREELGPAYGLALKDLLDGGDPEVALMKAYELGRRAMAGGMGILDTVSVHSRALKAALAERTDPRQMIDVVEAARAFLLESLSPFEMTHSGVLETNAALRHLNETLEVEAQRIARALHDDAEQLLASVHIALSETARGLPERARLQIDEVRDLLRQVEGELRQLSHELRPTVLDDLGLLPALEYLAEGVAKRARLQISVRGSESGRLPPSIEVALYRIVQQALSNITRHAHAQRVRIFLERAPRQVRCAIADNGVGFDVEEVLGRVGDRGLGLIGMRERADAVKGTVRITSTAGRGTEITVVIPLEA